MVFFIWLIASQSRFGFCQPIWVWSGFCHPADTLTVADREHRLSLACNTRKFSCDRTVLHLSIPFPSLEYNKRNLFCSKSWSSVLIIPLHCTSMRCSAKLHLLPRVGLEEHLLQHKPEGSLHHAGETWWIWADYQLCMCTDKIQRVRESDI